VGRRPENLTAPLRHTDEFSSFATSGGNNELNLEPVCVCVPATRSVQAIKYNAAAVCAGDKVDFIIWGLAQPHAVSRGNKEQTEFRSLGKLEGAFGSLRETSRPRYPSAGTAHPPGSHPSLENTGILTYAKRVLFVYICAGARAHHSLHYDIWVCVSVALFSPLALSEACILRFHGKSLMWRNSRGDESIYMGVYIFLMVHIKFSQSCTADGILSFKGEKVENELFCVVLPPC
jgi:hypothetical protein